MANRLDDQVLQAGLDDWVPLAAVEIFARQAGAKDDGEALTMILQTITDLVSKDLVGLGDVSDGGFFEWTEPLDEGVRRIASAWREQDERSRGFACWLSNTPKGDEQARKDGAG